MRESQKEIKRRWRKTDKKLKGEVERCLDRWTDRARHRTDKRTENGKKASGGSRKL